MIPLRWGPLGRVIFVNGYPDFLARDMRRDVLFILLKLKVKEMMNYQPKGFCTLLAFLWVGGCLSQALVAAPVLAPQDSIIHNAYKKQLHNAAKGPPVDMANKKAEVTAVVERQIAAYLKQVNKSSEPSAGKHAAAITQDEDLTENLTRLVMSELQHSEISSMEATSIRETFDYLGIHIDWNYSIVKGAIPEEQTVVKIRLPKFHSCPGCKKILESKLNEQKGIERVFVDTDTCTAQLIVDRDLDILDVLTAVEKSPLAQLVGWELIRK